MSSNQNPTIRRDAASAASLLTAARNAALVPLSDGSLLRQPGSSTMPDKYPQDWGNPPPHVTVIYHVSTRTFTVEGIIARARSGEDLPFGMQVLSMSDLVCLQPVARVIYVEGLGEGTLPLKGWRIDADRKALCAEVEVPTDHPLHADLMRSRAGIGPLLRFVTGVECITGDAWRITRVELVHVPAVPTRTEKDETATPGITTHGSYAPSHELWRLLGRREPVKLEPDPLGTFVAMAERLLPRVSANESPRFVGEVFHYLATLVPDFLLTGDPHDEARDTRLLAAYALSASPPSFWNGGSLADFGGPILGEGELSRGIAATLLTHQLLQLSPLFRAFPFVLDPRIAPQSVRGVEWNAVDARLAWRLGSSHVMRLIHRVACCAAESLLLEALRVFKQEAAVHYLRTVRAPAGNPFPWKDAFTRLVGEYAAEADATDATMQLWTAGSYTFLRRFLGVDILPQFGGVVTVPTDWGDMDVVVLPDTDPHTPGHEGFVGWSDMKGRGSVLRGNVLLAPTERPEGVASSVTLELDPDRLIRIVAPA